MISIAQCCWQLKLKLQHNRNQLIMINSLALLSLALLIWAALREKVPNVLSHCHTKRSSQHPD